MSLSKMVKNIFTHKSVNFSKTEMNDGMGPLSPLAIISLHWIERKQSWEINKPEPCYFSQTLKGIQNFESSGAYSLSSCFQFWIKSGIVPFKLLSFTRLQRAVKRHRFYNVNMSLYVWWSIIVQKSLQIRQVFQPTKFLWQIPTQIIGG
jgi:hypothetical protein